MQSVRLCAFGRMYLESCPPRTTPSGVSSALWSEPTGRLNPAPAPPWERVPASGVGIGLAGDTFRAGPVLVFASDPKDARPGEFWTRNISECPNGAVASSLWHVLEAPGSIPPRYFLSAKACAGILRRADKRGRQLPEPLRRALEAQARRNSN